MQKHLGLFNKVTRYDVSRLHSCCWCLVPMSGGDSPVHDLNQGWWGETCGRREHLIWPRSEFSLPKLEHNIASKEAP